MNKIIFLFMVSALRFNAVGQDVAKINQRDSLKIGEHTRSFLFHTPSNIAKKPKLLFVLHGSGGTGELMTKFTDGWFGKLADEQGNVIVVYPNGYKKHWNDCRKEANFEANLENIDDNTFFKEVINYFVKNYGVNPKQVFVAGHSNGGHQVFKLAKEIPQYFRKFAAVSANLPTPSNEDCFANGKPVSIMVINGTGDAVNPYNGGEVVLPGDAKRGNVISTNETMNYWASLAKINFATASSFEYPDINKEDGTTATLYQAKRKKFDVRLVKVTNGGHAFTVPTVPNPPAVLGNFIRDINMAKVVFDYFMER